MTVFLHLRSGNSGPAFVGENDGDTLLWSVAEGKFYVGPGGGGAGVTSFNGRTGVVVPADGDYDSDQVDNVSTVTGASVSDALEHLQTEIDGLAFAPIQNVRWYDARFAGVATGSIAAPFTTFAEFDSAVNGQGDTGWMLTLPGLPITVDDSLSDYNASPTVVFQGVDKLATVLDALDITHQTGNARFVFRELSLTELHLHGSSAASSFVFESVKVDAITSAGTLQGTVVFLNCDVTDATPGNFGPSLEMRGGTVSGGLSFENASFYNVTIENGANLDFGAHVIDFVGCKFGTGVTISNGGNPTIALDPESYYWFIANAVTYTGDIRLTPVVPQLGQVQLTGAGNNIAGGGQSTFDFGDPLGGLRPAEPGSVITGSWASDPGNVGFAILGLSVDAGTGHVMATIGNNTGNTHTLSNPTTIAIVYHPREQA